MSRRITRRRFLQTSAAVAATSYFVNPTPAAQPAAEDRVRVGIIGINGQGGWNLGEVVNTKLAEIVALCDVDATRSAETIRRFPKATFYEDYRRMIDRQKDL